VTIPWVQDVFDKLIADTAIRLICVSAPVPISVPVPVPLPVHAPVPVCTLVRY
jgi:hypothetical protein